jgi:VanZ family protein
LKFHYYVIIVLYCVAIFWLSSIPVSVDAIPLDIRFGIPYLDKILHAIIYGLLAAVISLGLRRSGRTVSPRVQFHLPWLFAAIYGLVIEIFQYFIPERYCEFADFLANTMGAVFVQIGICLLIWRIPIRAILPRP